MSAEILDMLPDSQPRLAGRHHDTRVSLRHPLVAGRSGNDLAILLSVAAHEFRTPLSSSGLAFSRPERPIPP
jgi:hypothetical protein